MEEYKYQISDRNGDRIYVVRSNSLEEVQLDIDILMSTKTPKVSPTQTTAAQESISTGLWCKKHNTAMKLNKNGKPYHMDRTRPEGDMFCNGRGYPSEFPGQSSERIGEILNEQ